MSDITQYHGNLPATMEELSKFVLIGREKLVAVRAEIKAIDKLQLAEEVRSQKRDEAQMLSEALLDAEVRIGELLKTISKNSGGDRRSKDFKIDTAVDFENRKTKAQMIENYGFTQKQAERFEILANNKDIVEEVKQEARENDDIPTRSRVIDLVAERKKQEQNYYKSLDLGHETFKRLAKIYDVIDNFEITDERIESLCEYFDENMPLEEQIGFINDAVSKLNKIKSELLRGKRYEKKYK